MELLNETKNDTEEVKVQRSCIACGSSTNKFKPKARHLAYPQESSMMS